MTAYDEIASIPLPNTDPLAEVTRHYQAPGAAILVPLAQSLITGLFSGLLASGIAILAGWQRAWLYFLIGWWLVQLIAWLISLRGWHRMIARLEGALCVDLNKDGFIGSDRQPEKQVIRIEVKEDDHTTKIAEIEIDPGRISQAARLALVSGSFSEGSLTGSGAPLSRSQFRNIRDKFLDRGWLEWRDIEAKNLGLKMTRSGKAVFKHLASQAESTNLPEGFIPLR